MLEINRHIADLLYTHECVILPRFGGFITQEHPAEFDRTSQVARPLRRSVAFNGQLKENDGLLIRSLAARKGVSYSAAQEEVRAFVQDLEECLEKEGNQLFAPLGTFYRRAENTIVFVADRSANFHPASFGLPSLKLPQHQYQPKSDAETTAPAAHTEPRAEKRLRQQENRVHPPSRRSTRLQVMNVMGSLLLLFMMIGMLRVELNDQASPVGTYQEAGMFGDSSADHPLGVDTRLDALLNAYSHPAPAIGYHILLDGTFSSTEVENIRAVFSQKFPRCVIIELENKEYTISVITFKDQELAGKYRDLIQQNIQYPLRLSAK